MGLSNRASGQNGMASISAIVLGMLNATSNPFALSLTARFISIEQQAKDILAISICAEGKDPTLPAINSSNSQRH